MKNILISMKNSRSKWKGVKMIDKDNGVGSINTDKEIWRENENDFYSPSIHVTKENGIGINVAGKVIVLPVKQWHEIAEAYLSGKLVELPSEDDIMEIIDQTYDVDNGIAIWDGVATAILNKLKGDL